MLHMPRVSKIIFVYLEAVLFYIGIFGFEKNFVCFISFSTAEDVSASSRPSNFLPSQCSKYLLRLKLRLWGAVCVPKFVQRFFAYLIK